MSQRWALEQTAAILKHINSSRRMKVGSPERSAEAMATRDSERADDSSLEDVMRDSMISKQTKEDVPVAAGEEQPWRPWRDIVADLLQQIFSRVRMADIPSFGAVCKHWSSFTYPVYPADASPLLMSSIVPDTGLLRCYSPYLNKIFVFRASFDAPGSEVCSGRNGWAMLRKPKKIAFTNLFDGAVHETPEHIYSEAFFCASWDRPPHKSTVVGIFSYTDSARLAHWDTESWHCSEQEHLGHFCMAFCCNPVAHNGVVYCLSENVGLKEEGGGRLGVYDPNERKWRVLEKPEGFSVPYKYAYLVESEGELLAVVTGKNGTPLHVFRLNEEEMEWQEMETLGGRALFTGSIASVSVSKPPKAMANKVYFPRFYGSPEVIQADLFRDSDGRTFFMEKGRRSHKMAASTARRKDDGAGAWCYDMESGTNRDFFGSKNMLRYVWVDLAVVDQTSESSCGDAVDQAPECS